MTSDGACPRCGGLLATPALATNARTVAERGPADRPEMDGGAGASVVVGGGADGEPKAPWHFKVLVGALVIYLGFRGVQGVEWLARHL